MSPSRYFIDQDGESLEWYVIPVIYADLWRDIQNGDSASPLFFAQRLKGADTITFTNPEART